MRVVLGGTLAAWLWIGAHRGDARLAWLVCAPLFVALDGERGSWRRAVVLGVGFALQVAVFGHFGWLSEAAASYFGLSPAAASAAAFALCVGCALPMGSVLGLLLYGVHRRTPIAGIAGGGAAWSAWESLVRVTFPFYPWVGLATTQADEIRVLQAVSLLGPGGLSLLLALAGNAIGCGASAWARARRRSAGGGRIPVAVFALAASLYGATWLGGEWRLRTAAELPAPPRCRIAAVDADVTPLEPAARALDRYVALSERAVALRPDAIVWPESALPSDPRNEPSLLRRLRDLSAAWGAVLLAGGPRFEWDEEWRPRLFNSVFRIAGAEPLRSYDKREPVPFAEAWPMPELLRPSGLDRLEVVAGGESAPMVAGDCRIGLLICFEAERSSLASDEARHGANALVVASNDAQLPLRAIEAEVAEARLRAVETGVPVLRAANGGRSLAIDRYGRTSTAPGGNIVLLSTGDGALAPAVSLAGPLIALCWMVVAAATVTRVFEKRRRRG